MSIKPKTSKTKSKGSYRYYAANKISNTAAKHKYENSNLLGGYIWHTTGSGKTMTSFKSAQLAANSKDTDKVVFLIDRKDRKKSVTVSCSARITL